MNDRVALTFSDRSDTNRRQRLTESFFQQRLASILGVVHERDVIDAGACGLGSRLQKVHPNKKHYELDVNVESTHIKCKI